MVYLLHNMTKIYKLEFKFDFLFETVLHCYTLLNVFSYDFCDVDFCLVLFYNIYHRKLMSELTHRFNTSCRQEITRPTIYKMGHWVKENLLKLAASPRRRGLTVASRLWRNIFIQSLRDCDLTTVASRLWLYLFNKIG